MVTYQVLALIEARCDGYIHFLVWHSDTGDVWYDGTKVIYWHLSEKLFHVVAQEMFGAKTWLDRAS